jgi:hypothetical protein
MEPDETHKKYVPPHERKDGWDDYELRDASDHLDRAEKISHNKPFLEAIRKHAEKRAEEHHATARRAHALAKSGHISPKAMARMKDE